MSFQVNLALYSCFFVSYILHCKAFLALSALVVGYRGEVALVSSRDNFEVDTECRNCFVILGLIKKYWYLVLCQNQMFYFKNVSHYIEGEDM